MLYFTKRFSTLVEDVQRSLGINFCDEKNQLRCSLGVFLVCYFLRALLKALTLIFVRVYGDMWGDPTLASSVVTLVQILTDVLPMMVICQQHHSAFSNEGRGATGITMTGQSMTTYTRDMTRLKSLSEGTYGEDLKSLSEREPSHEDSMEVTKMTYLGGAANRSAEHRESDIDGKTAENSDPIKMEVDMKSQHYSSSSVAYTMDSQDDESPIKLANQDNRENTMVEEEEKLLPMQSEEPIIPSTANTRQSNFNRDSAHAVEAMRRSVVDVLKMQGFGARASMRNTTLL